MLRCMFARCCELLCVDGVWCVVFLFCMCMMVYASLRVGVRSCGLVNVDMMCCVVLCVDVF